MLKMLLSIIWEAPQKISTIFKPFLAIFTLFHLINWPYLQKPEFVNLTKTRFWLLQVNNSLCSILLSYARSEIKEIPGDKCGHTLPPTVWPYAICHCQLFVDRRVAMLVTCFSMGQAPELPQAGGHALAVPAGGGRSQHQGARQSAHGAAGDRGDLKDNRIGH